MRQDYYEEYNPFNNTIEKTFILSIFTWYG